MFLSVALNLLYVNRRVTRLSHVCIMNWSQWNTEFSVTAKPLHQTTTIHGLGCISYGWCRISHNFHGNKTDPKQSSPELDRSESNTNCFWKQRSEGLEVSLGDRVAGSTLTSLFYEYDRHTHGIVITFEAVSFRWSFEKVVHLYK